MHIVNRCAFEMVSWTFNLYLSHRIYSFLIHSHTQYADLVQNIRTHLKLSSKEKFLIEIYDIRFRKYLILDNEYLINLQDRPPNTNISTLNGRIRFSHLSIQSINTKHQRTYSYPIENDQLIVWFDQSDSVREFKHRFYITTMFDQARSMLDFDYSIDNLIQTDLKSIDKIKHLNIFSNKDECLAFLKCIKTKNKILFIISDCSSEEIVPLVSQHVQMIYIYFVYQTRFSYEWILDYQSNVLIFDDNNHLLVRVIRDLAEYFLEKAEIISNLSSRQAIVLFKRSKNLFHRANLFAEPSFFKTLHFIEEKIASLEMNIGDKDDKLALECDEG